MGDRWGQEQTILIHIVFHAEDCYCDTDIGIVAVV